MSVLLAATDLGLSGARAVELAVRAARDLDLRLRLAHVTAPLPWPAVPASGVEGADEVFRERLRGRVARAEEALKVECARAAELGVPCEAVTLHGRPQDALLEEARRVGAELIVIGPHARPGGEIFAGSTAARVLRDAPCPVLVCPRLGSWAPRSLRFGRWLVAIDESAASRLALLTARRLAAQTGATLIAVHAVPTAMTASERRHFERTLREHLGAELEHTELVVLGDPPGALAEAALARDADLIIVGTRGLRGLASLIMRSTAEATLRVAPVPTLCVRAA